MKLAEALLLRSEHKSKLDNLQQRLLSNVKVQESDSPLENPQTLIEESFAISEKLCELIKQINVRNNTAKLDNGLTLSEALIHRDMVGKKINILATVANKAIEKDYRLTHSEVKMNVIVPVAEIQKQIDTLSKEYRELDTKIQSLNWTVDL
ncbi:MAG: DIP1984 family protein [Defluviitaleaceae bacterium]|nr:DIP1984 family protein [Defluviitaleaceae bacterium]